MRNPKINKRLFPRVELKNPLRFQRRGYPQAYTTLSDDVSLSGLSMINDSFLAPETQVMLELSLLSRVLKPIGSVAWSYRLSHSDKYKTGIKFIEFDESEKRYLADFISIKNQK